MRKRSAYRPKYQPGTLPVTFGLTRGMKTDLQITPLGTLEAFLEGTGTENGAHTLAAAVNLAAVMARSQPLDVQGEVGGGLVAMRAVFARGDETGKWGVTGDEYRAIRLALILGADMQDGSTRRAVSTAIQTTLMEAAV